MKRSVLINFFKSSALFLAVLFSTASSFAQKGVSNPGSQGQSSSWEPFKLINFDAILDNSNVRLSWTRVLEENLNSFTVERSMDGKNFKEIALVFGDEKYRSNVYKYKDANVISSTSMVFYRLRFVDEVGRIFYSGTRIVRLVKGLETRHLASYPNPVQNELKITFPVEWQGKTVQVELLSITGLKLQVTQLANVNQTETLQVGNLPRGIFVVQAKCNNQLAAQAVVKS